jgi:hypothetical protein
LVRRASSAAIDLRCRQKQGLPTKRQADGPDRTDDVEAFARWPGEVGDNVEDRAEHKNSGTRAAEEAPCFMKVPQAIVPAAFIKAL